MFQTFNYIFLAALVLLCLYPMWYCLMASISNPGAMMRHMGPLLLPKGFSLASYGKVFANPNIISGYKNTIFILVVGVILCLLMTSLGAYVLSRKDLLFRKPLMMIIMFTMFFTGGLIPTYLNLKELHLTNSLWGLIIPFLVNTFNLIILRTSFESIPDSLIEAAQIDGASHWKILISIVLPLSKATLAVMVLYYGVEKWNGWFWASALIRNRELLPLQVILREILLSSTQSMQTGAGAGDTEAIGATIRYATTIVATVPILCVYPFVQKHFTKGVMVGAVKE
ncbi:carbohydrate ABC transporter permease [Eisenbergiella porci]|uniref:carbohydrate ABC transporter permease n=1 Tax=Eisenbergiella porci TaxID=2652274 RepID=UPI003A8CCB3E